MSNTGWSDDRFMQAYGLIEGIRSDHSTPFDNLLELRDLLSDIESADTLLATVLADRAKGEQA
ncbi:hypothetical protein SAMN05660666_02528 [Novosphingobium aromaticivorans]|jgi:hypothetical protein|uniref:hypothetical protein n=1 Tax=Novosphingobium aromaticivorans TaxID=48935 RepID=UPI0000389B49|nr:hypothetical protein [Novosphingobium aromaticivorans]SCY69692.1 hypothetical protein SAMN05660666_02528 [Novosphingobium aromaticivorans]